jgi:hypothetical protein
VYTTGGARYNNRGRARFLRASAGYGWGAGARAAGARGGRRFPPGYNSRVLGAMDLGVASAKRLRATADLQRDGCRVNSLAVCVGGLSPRGCPVAVREKKYPHERTRGGTLGGRATGRIGSSKRLLPLPLAGFRIVANVARSK